MKYCLVFFLISSFVCFAQDQGHSPVPDNCRQMLLIVADSITSTGGNLICFERESDNSKWIQTGDTIPVVLGRNGLGWGRGLNQTDSSKLPMKTEGDGRSPAGVFTLSAAFGYAGKEEMEGLKIPYIHITKMLECVDDIKSRHYNQLVYKNEVKEPDWESSEKMYFAKIWYEQGVIIDHNANPVINGAGSCIFLHNWSRPDETTSGCTEMEPVILKKIIYWLDSSANPVFIQLTKQLYNEYQKSWELP